jgi:hypothetical protein
MNMQQPGCALNISLGQRVRHKDYKCTPVTGIVRSLSNEAGRIIAAIALDQPIVIPARSEGDREIQIHHQTVPAIELTPFDPRDAIIDELRAALRSMLDYHDDAAKAPDQRLLDAGYAALAKAEAAA